MNYEIFSYAAHAIEIVVLLIIAKRIFNDNGEGTGPKPKVPVPEPHIMPMFDEIVKRLNTLDEDIKKLDKHKPD